MRGITLRKLSAIFTTVILLTMMSPANANDYIDFRSKLNAARASLVTLMTEKDQRGPEQQKLVKDTADAVSAQLAKMKAPAGKEAQFKELVDTWAAFKDTRENKLVPAILKGDAESVKELTFGIQKERLAKCLSLAKELEK